MNIFKYLSYKSIMIRDKVKKIKQLIYYKNINKKYTRNPITPWAFIRVKNEIETIEQCLNSILPVIKKGVIGYHKLSDNEIDDGTEKFILEFCKNNRGYIPYKYEYEVIPANDKRYLNFKKVNKENRLDSFYNAVLQQIPKNEWIIKIDCDHIYDTEKLKKLMYLPQNIEEVILFSRFNLHYFNKELYVIRDDYLRNPGDHWLIYNNNLFFDFKIQEKNRKLYAWEQLNLKEKIKKKEIKLYNTDLFNWHFPFIKSSRNIDESNLIEFDRFKFKWWEVFLYKISKDMYDKEKIIKYLTNKEEE